MSSTWFRGMRAIKKTLDTGYNLDNPYKEDKYILIADTAESNLFTDTGAHIYHEWIYASGSYSEVMRRVCEFSYAFEDGSDKWKPHAKDAAGFIKSCKKALLSAKELDYIPCNINAVLLWRVPDTDGARKELSDKLESFKTVRKVKQYGSICYVTDYVETYIRAKALVDCVVREYPAAHVGSSDDRPQFSYWFNQQVMGSSYWCAEFERIRKIGETDK